MALINEARIKALEDRLARLEARLALVSDVALNTKAHSDVLAANLEALATDPALTPGTIDSVAMVSASNMADRAIRRFAGGSQSFGVALES